MWKQIRIIKAFLGMPKKQALLRHISNTGLDIHKGFDEPPPRCRLKPLTMLAELCIRPKTITFMLIIVPEAIKKFNIKFMSF